MTRVDRPPDMEEPGAYTSAEPVTTITTIAPVRCHEAKGCLDDNR